MSKPSPVLFLSVVTAMASVSLFATDIYLPALPEMAQYFQCTHSEIQASLTVFLVGLVVCQLITGILSDTFGRKRVALIGLSIFTMASLGCAFATTLPQFVIGRLLQAIGGGVGSVTSRALIADRFEKQEAVKVFSTVFPIVGLSSAIGPFVGGYLTHYWGWQSTFYFVALFGLSILAMIRRGLAQGPCVLNRTPSRYSVEGYKGVLKNGKFLGYILVLTCSFCAFRSYTIESPFVFSHLGFGAKDLGHFYVSLSIAYLSGNLIARKLSHTYSIQTLLQIGIGFFGLGGASMVGSALYLNPAPVNAILPMVLIGFGNGFIFPVSSAAAMSAVSPSVTGMASGVMGALQFTGAAICVSWVGTLCQGQLRPLAFFIGAITLIGCSSHFLLKRYAFKTENGY